MEYDEASLVERTPELPSPAPLDSPLPEMDLASIKGMSVATAEEDEAGGAEDAKYIVIPIEDRRKLVHSTIKDIVAISYMKGYKDGVITGVGITVMGICLGLLFNGQRVH